MRNQPRSLEREEMEALLSADVPARLATVDRHGFPHITPLWFIWDEDAFRGDTGLLGNGGA